MTRGIDPRKIGTRNPDGRVWSPEALPGPDHRFVLVAVGSRGARGYRDGISCLAIA